MKSGLSLRANRARPRVPTVSRVKSQRLSNFQGKSTVRLNPGIDHSTGQGGVNQAGPSVIVTVKEHQT